MVTVQAKCTRPLSERHNVCLNQRLALINDHNACLKFDHESWVCVDYDHKVSIESEGTDTIKLKIPNQGNKRERIEQYYSHHRY